MFFFPDLKRRALEPEVMDDPDIDRTEHYNALRGLARLNQLSLSARILWLPIKSLAKAHVRPLRVLDIATGSGDIPVALQRRASRHQVDLDITATDISEQALQFASQRAEQAGVRIEFRPLDIFKDEIAPEYDVIICSLFLHHLTDAQALRLLTQITKAARTLVLVNDLQRCRMGYFLAYAAGRIFTSSRVVHTDGPLSVQAAFTIPEVRSLAEQAGISGARVSARWPWRYLLEWQKDGDHAHETAQECHQR